MYSLASLYWTTDGRALRRAQALTHACDATSRSTRAAKNTSRDHMTPCARASMADCPSPPPVGRPRTTTCKRQRTMKTKPKKQPWTNAVGMLMLAAVCGCVALATRSQATPRTATSRGRSVEVAAPVEVGRILMLGRRHVASAALRDSPPPEGHRPSHVPNVPNATGAQDRADHGALGLLLLLLAPQSKSCSNSRRPSLLRRQAPGRLGADGTPSRPDFGGSGARRGPPPAQRAR